MGYMRRAGDGMSEREKREQEWREFHDYAKRLIADSIIREGFAGIGGALHMIYQGWATLNAKPPLKLLRRTTK